jgi:hypothetical protein
MFGKIAPLMDFYSEPGESTKTWLHLPFESHEGLQLRLHTRSRCNFHCLAARGAGAGALPKRPLVLCLICVRGPLLYGPRRRRRLVGVLTSGATATPPTSTCALLYTWLDRLTRHRLATSLRIAVRSREKNTTLKNKDKWF